jgi:hypothetical protein
VRESYIGTGTFGTCLVARIGQEIAPMKLNLKEITGRWLSWEGTRPWAASVALLDYGGVESRPPGTTAVFVRLDIAE